jgi:uncharacterized protein YjbI with pentapeptide repeats
VRWKSTRGRAKRWLGIVGLAAIALLVVVALVWPITDLIAGHDVSALPPRLRPAHLQAARETARTQLLTLGAGLFAAGALWFTYRNFVLSRESQVTDRYTKAIKQLGSGKLDVRIGGIYALERVARDSATDHPTVMEVLSAFIREHSNEPWQRADPSSKQRDQAIRDTVSTPDDLEYWNVPSPLFEPGGVGRDQSTRPDVQAAVTVICRRNTERDILPINLAGATLTGVNLNRADLAGARLEGTVLTSALFYKAFLTGAHLDEADLTRAFLQSAHLSDARLNHAILSGAKLLYADLANAFLSYATLDKADLAQARLPGAQLFRAVLTGAQLNRADLTGAHLGLADLTGADLTGANLTGARLMKATLAGAKLEGAVLAGAILISADLTNVTLDGADLTDADLRFARWPEHVAAPEGWQLRARDGSNELWWPGSWPRNET